MVGEERTVNGQEMAAGSNRSENETVIEQGGSCKGVQNTVGLQSKILLKKQHQYQTSD